ncbi:MAG: acyl carrier protein [Acidobacteria bacterium]|nr:acyl carrier protein [Acidobacteriota bacterium]MCZ6727932.1 acyl carrier protein [Acidobacteriota bacterium]
MRTRSQILDEIQTIAADTLDWSGTISETSNLVEDLGLDSLSALTLVIEIENRLRIRLAPEDEAELLTVGDLLTAIERRLTQAGETA